MAKDDKKKEDGAAEKAELSPEEAAAKAKKKKLLFLAIGGVLILGGVGGGLAFFLSGGGETELAARQGPGPAAKTPAPVAEEAPVSAEAPTAAGAQPAEAATTASGTAGPKPKSAIDFGCTTDLKPFHLNLGNPLENRYIRLGIAVEHACTEEVKNEVERRLPQLRDAIIAITSRKTREFLLGPDGKAQLRKEVTTRINQYMDHKVHDVYITDILIE